MNISDLAEDYLIDRKDRMRKLTASFLNEVMQHEAENQSRPDLMNAPARERHIGMEKDHDYSRLFKTKSSLINLKSEVPIKNQSIR